MKNHHLNLIINELSEVVVSGFNQSVYFGDSEGVFRTHFDWHSSVHAQWMLLSSSRVFGNEVINQKIRARFAQPVIDSELAKLRANPAFELPYGQVWLVLLLSELEKYNEVDVQNFKKQTAERIFSWLAGTEFPETNPNSYHSWLFTYFLIKKCNLPEFSDDLMEADKKFNVVNSVRDENDPKDFFSSESLFRLLKGIPNPHLNSNEDLKRCAPIVMANCHTVGRIVSKSWRAPHIQESALAEATQFVYSVIKEPQFWKNDFKTVAHWVPQFLWFGIWLALGEP